MKAGVLETGRELYFHTSINREIVTVRLELGWICIDRNHGKTGPFGVMGKDRITRETYTTEDARNLIAAIQELLPKQESDGKSENKP